MPAPLVLVTPKAVVAEAPAGIEGDTVQLEVVSGSVERSAPRSVQLNRLPP